jgi:hypothetical protein
VKADGIEELWADGELALRRDGLRFRRVPELRITAFELEVYYHGLPAKYTAEAPQKVYFDNVVIATARIGRLSPARPCERGGCSGTTSYICPGLPRPGQGPYLERDDHESDGYATGLCNNPFITLIGLGVFAQGQERKETGKPPPKRTPTQADVKPSRVLNRFAPDGWRSPS